ncbi:MAG: AEC family transporter [Alphaproteobacteria bacterium]
MSALSNLFSVFLIIAIGAALKSSHMIRRETWDGFERVTYLILFPAMIISTMANADLGSTPFLSMGATLVISLLTIAAGLLLFRKILQTYFAVDGASFSSIFQGAIRWNSFVAFALATSLHGREGATLCAVAIAAMIPLLNFLSVGVITRYAQGQEMSLSRYGSAIIKNPFIWSCVIGLLLNSVVSWIPAPIFAPITLIGQASLAAGLLAAGAGLELQQIPRIGAPHVIALTAKLIVMPLLAVAFAQILGVSGTAFSVTILSMSVPTASASYILARQLGGNASLMAEILTLQTLGAMITIPLIYGYFILP